MAFLNIKYPIEDSVEDNFFLKRNTTTIEAIKSNILLLLTTERGTRYYNRDFGSNVQKFLFEPNDSVTQTDIEEDIKSTISKFIPQIKVNSITFNVPDNNRNQIIVDIQFTYSDANAVFRDNISIQIE